MEIQQAKTAALKAKQAAAPYHLVPPPYHPLTPSHNPSPPPYQPSVSPYHTLTTPVSQAGGGGPERRGDQEGQAGRVRRLAQGGQGEGPRAEGRAGRRREGHPGRGRRAPAVAHHDGLAPGAAGRHAGVGRGAGRRGCGRQVARRLSPGRSPGCSGASRGTYSDARGTVQPGARSWRDHAASVDLTCGTVALFGACLESGGRRMANERNSTMSDLHGYIFNS